MYVGADVTLKRKNKDGWKIPDLIKGKIVVDAPMIDGDRLLSVEVPSEPLVYLCVRASRLRRVGVFDWFIQRWDHG